VSPAGDEKQANSAAGLPARGKIHGPSGVDSPRAVPFPAGHHQKLVVWCSAVAPASPLAVPPAADPPPR
jgi:hypothetical protein